MTPRERLLKVLKRQNPDSLALTIWNNKLPGGEADRQILDMDICVIVKSSVWQMEFSGITIEYHDEAILTNKTRRTIMYHTPYGILQEVRLIEPGTTWITEFPFKGPDDYNAIEAFIESRMYTPDYNRFMADDKLFGESSIARPVTIHSPFHDLMYEFMGLETYSFELTHNYERILHLETVLKADWLRRIKILTGSPARYAVIEGNTDFSVVGPYVFQEHYLPNIQEACRLLHKNNIYAGAHLDSNNKNLAPLFAQTSLDFIESFTPPPDCNMTVTEARNSWPEKALLVNFPSSVFLNKYDILKSYCKSLISEFAIFNGVAIGISEDIPAGKADVMVQMFRYLRDFSKMS